MDFSQILDAIPTKKVEDILYPKIQIEDCEKIHPLLTLDNYLTYMVFLEKRPDLTEEEKEVIYQIIKRLQDNEKLEYKLHMEKMLNPSFEEKGEVEEENIEV
jgi:hypothetical protein